MEDFGKVREMTAEEAKNLDSEKIEYFALSSGEIIYIKKSDEKGEPKKENEPPKEEEKAEQINLEENQVNDDNNNIQNDPVRKYNIDDSLKKVTTVRKRDNKLMAVVVKMNELGMTNEIEIETNNLKYDNPWILLDFYESKIKFT